MTLTKDLTIAVLLTLVVLAALIITSRPRMTCHSHDGSAVHCHAVSP